jgi:hypothetical protein
VVVTCGESDDGVRTGSEGCNRAKPERTSQH